VKKVLVEAALVAITGAACFCDQCTLEPGTEAHAQLFSGSNSTFVNSKSSDQFLGAAR